MLYHVSLSIFIYLANKIIKKYCTSSRRVVDRPKYYRTEKII